jgi:hypothetical protein
MKHPTAYNICVNHRYSSQPQVTSLLFSVNIHALIKEYLLQNGILHINSSEVNIHITRMKNEGKLTS